MAVVGFKSTRINAKRLIEHIHLKHSLDNLLAHALQYFFLATRIFQNSNFTRTNKYEM